MSGTASSDLTGPACSPNGIHWTYDTYALGKVAGNAMVARGADGQRRKLRCAELPRFLVAWPRLSDLLL